MVGVVADCGDEYAGVLRAIESRQSDIAWGGEKSFSSRGSLWFECLQLGVAI